MSIYVQSFLTQHIESSDISHALKSNCWFSWICKTWVSSLAALFTSMDPFPNFAQLEEQLNVYLICPIFCQLCNIARPDARAF